MLYSIQLPWLAFNVDLNTVEAWLKANCGTYYAGNSADSQLTLWFSQEPDIDTKNAIQTYWNGLTEASTEATNYVSQAELLSACNTLRAGLLTKTWDQMSAAERKLVVGQMPTKTELGL